MVGTGCRISRKMFKHPPNKYRTVCATHSLKGPQRMVWWAEKWPPKLFRFLEYWYLGLLPYRKKEIWQIFELKILR